MTVWTMADLVIPFKVDVQGDVCAAMARALVQYLLYLRGQIPCVYDEFVNTVRSHQAQEDADRTATGSKKRKLVSGCVKKSRKLVDAVDHVLGPALVQVCIHHVKTVAIVFGATVVSPREVWILHIVDCLEGTQTTRPNGGGLSQERVVTLCVQKLIRTVLSYATQHFSNKLAHTTTHVLVRAQKNDDAIDGFIPKQNLRIRLPKEKKEKRVHHILIQSNNTKAVVEDGDPSELPALNDEDGTFIWYQATKPLIGVSKMV